MVPIIGIMVGLYIVTRMLDLTLDESRPRLPIVKAAAVVTMLAAALGMLMLLASGSGM